MTRDELKKLLKSNLVDLALQQQTIIEELRARVTRLEDSWIQVRDEQSHARVPHQRRERFFGRFARQRAKNFNIALIVMIGVIVTVVIVLLMNGYHFW